MNNWRLIEFACILLAKGKSDTFITLSRSLNAEEKKIVNLDILS